MLAFSGASITRPHFYNTRNLCILLRARCGRPYHSINTPSLDKNSIPRNDYTVDGNVARSNWLITNLSREGRVGEARRVFDEMPDRDVVTWTTVISGYIKCGMMEEARNMFDSVDAEKNVVTWIAKLIQSPKTLWIPEDSDVDLPSLNSLEIWLFQKLVSFPWGGLPAPNLTFFRVCGCMNLKSLPENMDTVLTSLQQLTLIHIGGSNSEHASLFPEDLLLPPTLTAFSFSAFSKLIHIHSRGLQHLTSLKRLSIFDCQKTGCPRPYLSYESVVVLC